VKTAYNGHGPYLAHQTSNTGDEQVFHLNDANYIPEACKMAYELRLTHEFWNTHRPLYIRVTESSPGWVSFEVMVDNYTIAENSADYLKDGSIDLLTTIEPPPDEAHMKLLAKSSTPTYEELYDTIADLEQCFAIGWFRHHEGAK
jgi:hypothetical protein